MQMAGNWNKRAYMVVEGDSNTNKVYIREDRTLALSISQIDTNFIVMKFYNTDFGSSIVARECYPDDP